MRITIAAETNQVAGRIALCAHCYQQRTAAPSRVTLEAVPLGIVSGYCHDCNAGWCECRGVLEGDRDHVYCPRKNSHVVLLTSLILYAIHVPAPPPTVPRPNRKNP